MKIALVHDYLIQEGGAENVLKVLHEMWPEAPIFTLMYDKERMGKYFSGADVRTSFLQKFPFSLRRYQWYLALMPVAIEGIDTTPYDVVISSSSSFSKGVITSPGTLHICYCYTPTRYLWSDTHSYVENLSYPNFVKRFIPPLLSKLRVWDWQAAQRADACVAISLFIQERIKKYYSRESSVIYPPVAVNNFSITKNIEKYYLTGGRLVPYKRFDIVVRAFAQLGIPLKIFGDGPEMPRLKKMARKNIEFLGRVSDEELPGLYSRASAFIHPQIEDFGLTTVEAMASGRPVIAFGQGGARETVLPGLTGEFFDEQTWEALADTIVRCKLEKFNPETLRQYAMRFEQEIFKENLRLCIASNRKKLYENRG